MKEKFEYKYSAPSIEERKEIDSIRKQYLPKEERETKMERLRYLDNLVKSVPTIYSLILGVIGSLVFGTGMTFFLEWKDLWYFGIPFCIIGIVMASLAYPVYKKKLKQYKDKYSKEIIDLSNELLGE